MSDTDVDDASPAIVYSSGWQALTGTVSQQFDSTIHQTSNTGATATITFSGTRIIVFLTNPMGTGEEAITTTLDGGSPSSMSRHQHDGTTYYQDRWFDSGNIAAGTHTLVLANAGVQGGTPLMLDKFSIDGNPIAPAQAPTTNAVNPAPAGPGTTATTTKTATVTQVQTTAAASSSASSSSLSASGSLTTSSSALPSSSATALLDLSQSGTASHSGSAEHTVVSVQYVTTGIDGRVSTINTVSTISLPTNIAQQSAAGAAKFPLVALIGAILGGLALLSVLMFVLCMMRRRRRVRERHIRLPDDAAEKSAGAGQDMQAGASAVGATLAAVPRPPRRPTDVTPFPLNSNRPTLVGEDGHNPSTDASAYLAHKASQSSHHGDPPSNRSHDANHEDIISSVNRSPSNSSSEKSSVFYSAASPSTPTNTPFSPSSPSHSPAQVPVQAYPLAAAAQQEVDAGPYPYSRRPQYLSGDTILAGSASDIYVSTMHHLSPIDSTDVPPSYQSARHISGPPTPRGIDTSMNTSFAAANASLARGQGLSRPPPQPLVNPPSQRGNDTMVLPPLDFSL